MGSPNSTGALAIGHARFELRAGTFKDRELEVISFAGAEKLNTPFTYDVTFATTIDEGEIQAEMFGFPACLTIYVANHDARVIQGIVVSLEAIGLATVDNAVSRKTYLARIVPPLWLLNHRQANRVFELQGAIDIANAMLKLASIDVTCFAKAADHPIIPFIYQRNETDLAFLERVLATAGIFYYFQHSSGLVSSLVPGGNDPEPACKAGPVTKLVFCDKADDTEAVKDGGAAPASGAPTSGGSPPNASTSDSGVGYTDGETFAYDPDGHLRDVERITAFTVRKEIRPGKAFVTDWNSHQDTAVTSDATGDKAVATVEKDSAGNSVHKVTGFIADTLATALGPDVLTVTEYQRDGAAIVGGSTGYYAKAALAQLRGDWVVARGTSDSPRLAPGYRFVLTDHPVTSLNGEYLVTETTSKGSHLDHLPKGGTDPFTLSFVCVPAKIHPRPAKPVLSPVLGGEPALVYGQTPGEINTDDMGRVQVQFRWGAPGAKPSDPASGICWARWLERWGGNGYGTVTVPRIGSDVWVEFPQQEGGVPMAVGQVYSNVNKPPWTLPAEASKTGIRTAFLSGGAKYSEISIEDKGGAECVHIRAQKDHTVNVVNSEMKTANDYALTTQKFIHETAGTDVIVMAGSTDAAGNIEQTAWNSVKLTAKTKTINFTAEKMDILASAQNNVSIHTKQENIYLQAESAKIYATAKTDIQLEATEKLIGTADTEIQLAGKTKVTIGDDKDGPKTSIVIESGTITITSEKDVVVNAGGKATVVAAKDVAVTSSGGNVVVKGAVIKLNA